MVEFKKFWAQKLTVNPFMTTEEATSDMEKTKQVKAGYTPPTETK